MTTRTSTRRRPQHTEHDIDRYIGWWLRQRRKSIGMTIAELSAQLGLSFQQVQKYETGFNKISASRLYGCACVLGVKIGYFYDGLEATLGHPPRSYGHLEERRLLFDLYSHVQLIQDERHKQVICDIARALSDSD